MDDPDFPMTPAPMTPAPRRRPSRRTLLTAGSAAGLAVLLGFGAATVADAQQAPMPWWTDDDGVTDDPYTNDDPATDDLTDDATDDMPAR